ncbi:DNA polymerase subunit beta [Ammoniphilus oxalaticus]|uniref:DNA polymerase subunit beta n=1 Tax=Ammoniphilus oxalaticus TaxID=66863 RepID=A0A419SMU6_9BACL|nr:nucleotidyltransferase domain-containing protein [Ammoniphilus oxalaticus]RKD25614.1 DNA polymerase subunit beta [Ammoniphilus oxalaticus]
MTTSMYDKIEEFLVQKLNPDYIIVFGSYAKGFAHQESDIDLAFYTRDQTPNAYDLFLVAQELADLLQVEVDLINIANASTVFKAQIFSTGSLIYARDEALYLNHRMTALSMYVKLNEDRAVVLREIKKGGSIYDE